MINPEDLFKRRPTADASARMDAAYGFLPPVADKAQMMTPPYADFAQPISYQRPMPQSDIPNQDLGVEILKQYVGNKQQQAQRGSLAQEILSKRFEPTMDDVVRANTQNTQAALMPEVYKATTANDLARNRLDLELAPYTTLAKLKELNQPYSEMGKLMYDVQEGLVSPDIAQAQMGKAALETQLKEAQIRATNALAQSRGQGMGAKAPSGYRYKDDNTLEAIPGGPATKLTPESAAKIGAVEVAMKNLPKIRNVMNSVNVFSAADWLRDAGAIGEAKRQVRQAVESALRAQTGAAAPETEVQRYTDLYMPRFDDTQATKQKKLDELEKFLSSTAAGMKLGRTPGDDASMLQQQQELPDYSGMSDEEILQSLSQ